MTPERPDDLVSTRISGIDSALLQISQGQDAKAAALTIRAHLIDLLSLLDRNPGLDAAADDFYNSVMAFVQAGAHSSGPDDRQVRLLADAYGRFSGRLEAAGVEPIPGSGGGPGVRLRKSGVAE